MRENSAPEVGSAPDSPPLAPALAPPRMASLLLAVTVAALALEPAAAASRAATGGVVAAPLQAAALSRLGQSASCDECVLIVSVVQNITENATTLAEVIAAFDGARERRAVRRGCGA